LLKGGARIDHAAEYARRTGSSPTPRRFLRLPQKKKTKKEEDKKSHGGNTPPQNNRERGTGSATRRNQRDMGGKEKGRWGGETNFQYHRFKKYPTRQPGVAHAGLSKGDHLKEGTQLLGHLIKTPRNEATNTEKRTLKPTREGRRGSILEGHNCRYFDQGIIEGSS